jgi:hypothetical protein
MKVYYTSHLSEQIIINYTVLNFKDEVVPPPIQNPANDVIEKIAQLKGKLLHSR